MKNLVDPEIPNVYLKPGELHVSKVPSLVTTVLGSCVSVILHAPEAGTGAMCHALLPSGERAGSEFRYVDSAVVYMYEQLRSQYGNSCKITAKLFGGAELMQFGNNHVGVSSVGQQNVEAATRIIARLGLRIAGSDTGGRQGRKLFFYTEGGEVFMRPVRKTLHR